LVVQGVVSASSYFVALRRNFTPHGLSPPKYVNAYQQYNAEVNPAMDQNPIQGGGGGNTLSCFIYGWPVAHVQLTLPNLTFMTKRILDLFSLPTLPIAHRGNELKGQTTLGGHVLSSV